MLILFLRPDAEQRESQAAGVTPFSEQRLEDRPKKVFLSRQKMLARLVRCWGAALGPPPGDVSLGCSSAVERVSDGLRQLIQFGRLGCAELADLNHAFHP